MPDYKDIPLLLKWKDESLNGTPHAGQLVPMDSVVSTRHSPVP